ncbi:MAG: wax ester/triacylglycerol synthase domain-containing protein, partial [Parahaliea sp.]
MSRLTATDALFAYADTPTTPMNMGSVQYLCLPEGGVDEYFERLKAFLIERCELVPKLRQRLEMNTVGLPVWETVDSVDYDYHIRRTRVRSGTDLEVGSKIGRLQHQPFDMSRPLFMFYLIEGLGEGRAILLQKFHHAMADGKTAMRLMDIFSDEGNIEAGEEPVDYHTSGWLSRSVGGAVEDTKRFWQSLGGLAGTGKALLGSESREMLNKLSKRPVTPLNRQLSDKRLFAARVMPL